MQNKESEKVIPDIQIKNLERSKKAHLIRGYIMIIGGIIFFCVILSISLYYSYADLFTLMYLILFIMLVPLGYSLLQKAKGIEGDIEKLKKINQ